jgi:hypothetical protein
MDARIGEWQVRVVPWVQYDQHSQGWITANVRKDGDKGRRSFWLAHNGSRWAHSTDSWTAEQHGIPMGDVDRYMRQVWGR